MPEAREIRPGLPTGLVVVLSGPSGVGKTTLTRELERRFDAAFSVSATTRPPAPDEVHGRDYFFISEAEFQSMIDRGELLEYAQVYGSNWYGTPRRPVEAQLARGKLVILDIDVQGGLQVRQRMPSALMIFLHPPSEAELLRRLRRRAREDEAVIQRRFAEAMKEIETARRGGYDAHVINDDLPRAVEEVCRIVEARLKTRAAM